MLESLPSEVLTSILAYTSSADLIASRSVSRRIKSVINSASMFKKKPDEICISTKCMGEIPQLGRLRLGVEEKRRKRIVVRLRKSDKRTKAITTEEIEADEIIDSVPSTSDSGALTMLMQTLKTVLHGSVLTLECQTISLDFLRLLSQPKAQMHRIFTIRMLMCHFTREQGLLEKLCEFISGTSCRQMEIEFCTGEEGIICDKLLQSLPLLQSLNIRERRLGSNTITDKTIESWLSRTSPPPQLINLTRSVTSITVGSIAKMIEVVLSQSATDKFSWNFGSISANNLDQLGTLLRLYHTGLTIAFHTDNSGTRIIKAVHPRLDVFFRIEPIDLSSQ